VRRDPRESPSPNNRLQQLERRSMLGHGKVVELHVQPAPGIHNLLFRPERFWLCATGWSNRCATDSGATLHRRRAPILVARARPASGFTAALEEWLQRSAGAVVERPVDSTEISVQDPIGQQLADACMMQRPGRCIIRLGIFKAVGRVRLTISVESTW